MLTRKTMEKKPKSHSPVFPRNNVACKRSSQLAKEISAPFFFCKEPFCGCMYTLSASRPFLYEESYTVNINDRWLLCVSRQLLICPCGKAACRFLKQESGDIILPWDLATSGGYSNRFNYS